MSSSEPRPAAPRRPLFRKYLLALFAAVLAPLFINGISEAWFGFRDQRTLLDARLRVEAAAASRRIQTFLDGMVDQLGWVVHLPWTEENAEGHRIDALRLLRQVPAIAEIVLLDGSGSERLRVSRISPDVVGGHADRSDDPAFPGARENRVWYGPVTLNRGSEPHMEIALAGNRSAAGVAVAMVNLKLIWDVVTQIQVGEKGTAFVIDSTDRLVAHPDIERVLRGTDPVVSRHVEQLRAALLASRGDPVTTSDSEGRSVLSAMAAVDGVGWTVVVEQPLSEAFAPIYAAIVRTLVLMAAAVALAFGLAYLLAARLTGPIRDLEKGVEQIGMGNFEHRIDIRTGDELEHLADRFNDMAVELALSQERSQRIARLRQFLSPQVAEIVLSSKDGGLLDPRRAVVAVVFCDLRGFTRFSDRVGPDEIMRVLDGYYDAVGKCVIRHEGTLTNFSGDGIMVVINAPLPCPEDPSVRAARLALDIQAAVAELMVGWDARGHEIGLGIGLATGDATVGRVGYEGRHDYTAIGSVVNLASRLCGNAANGQILMDTVSARAVAREFPVTDMGPRSLKGFDEAVAVSMMAGDMSIGAGMGSR